MGHSGTERNRDLQKGAVFCLGKLVFYLLVKEHVRACMCECVQCVCARVHGCLLRLEE